MRKQFCHDIRVCELQVGVNFSVLTDNIQQPITVVGAPLRPEYAVFLRLGQSDPGPMQQHKLQGGDIFAHNHLGISQVFVLKKLIDAAHSLGLYAHKVVDDFPAGVGRIIVLVPENRHSQAAQKHADIHKAIACPGKS